MADEYEVFTNFVGSISKVQTTSGGDGDFRITIDIPGRCMEAVKELMEAQNKRLLCAFAVAKKKGVANPNADLAEDF